MSEIKDKLKGVKDKVMGAGEETKDTVTGGSSSTSGRTGAYEEGAPGTETGRKDDPLTSYREKEPMTPGDQKIVEPGQTGTNPDEASEIARKKGMAKGTAGAAETGSEYEQGAAGSNK